MSTQNNSNSGTVLMSLMAAAVIAGVAVISAFCAHATWALLPVVMVSMIAAAGFVCWALARLLDDGPAA
jgi:hypothetical protein